MAEKNSLVLEELLKKQRTDYFNNPYPYAAKRKKILLKLKKMLIDYEEDWIKALVADTDRAPFEGYSFEIAVLLNEIDYQCRKLRKWMKPDRSWHLKLGYVEAIKKTQHPYGSVLIISPWNYPLQLALMPAISAIAAGNRCVIKASEYAPATSKLLKKVIRRLFPPKQLAVVTGDAQTAEFLTTLPFNLIFFTGGQQTGKKVAQQAASQLIPAVLELGGKNPCILDETGFSEAAIREIVWGKFLNAGQTCIAPDTLFVHTSVYKKLLSEISAALIDFYGKNPKNSKDYGRICHTAHFQKVIDFIGQGKVRHGGNYDQKNLFIAPTILTDIKPGSAILKEEIFGPVLPVVPYTDLESLFSQQLIQRDALTAYVFSKNKQHIRMIKRYMHSTSISINQVIHHAANPHVAFGGTGRSGYGTYHGKAGFYACSYDRTDYKAYHYMHVPDKFPPYSNKDMRILKRLRKWLL
ncbi:aldehyde dehydrogenase [Virgibacillus siamensis]|uniref:Aldehyde dehydrogenase n=1 Tax=Virgibacillus siamensis TaxID=480071 RepID=A0ABP3R0R0_9BACI